MKTCVLASGSKGNSTLIRTKKLNILIDAGMTCKYLEEKLKDNNLKIEDIDYVFLTHTHIDHTNALPSLIKRHKPIIALTDKMHMSLKYLDKYDNIFLFENDFNINDLKVEIINTSHDSSDSKGYIFTEDSSSIVIITDTGYINSKLWDKLSNKSLYILECNHDIEMLMHGKYPKWLKRRVGSDIGHLSNQSSAYYLSKLIGPNTKHVFLAHISQENNTPELALECVKECLLDSNIEFNNIMVTSQNEQTEMVEV